MLSRNRLIPDKDKCFDCKSNFIEKKGDLLFYTVSIKSCMRKCCHRCFSKYRNYWII